MISPSALSSAPRSGDPLESPASQVCFVLAADAWNPYVAMCCVAAATVRRWHADCRILLLCDERTATRLAPHRHRLAGYFDEIVAVPVPLDDSVERSRYLKTTMRRWLRGDFVYLDVDTLTLGSLAPLFRRSSWLGLTLERNAPETDIRAFPRVLALYEQLGWHLRPRRYFNGGMMWVRDDDRAAELFARWHERWQITRAAGCSADQPSLNMAVCELEADVDVLPAEWNAMVLFSPSRWRGCRVAHFFASNHFPSTILGHLVERFESGDVIDWPALDRCVAEGHPWGPNPEPWQLWRSGHYARAVVRKCLRLCRMVPAPGQDRAGRQDVRPGEVGS